MTHVVDWKTEVESSFRFGTRAKRVSIPSALPGVQEAFDYTLKDGLAYVNPRFRNRILETVAL